MARKRPKPKTKRSEADTEDEAKAEEAFRKGLLTRREALPPSEDGALEAGQTHEVIEDEDGKQTVVRRRYSAY